MITAWCAEDFIEPAIEQAIKYCDEVLICVAPHSEAMRRFDDGTKAKAERLARGNEKIKWVEWNSTNFHATTKANILNNMLRLADYTVPGNWVWILDVDEFYPERTYRDIKLLLEHQDFDQVIFEEWYFYINMWYCLEGEHIRLFKIKNGAEIFQPTQRWVYATNPVTTDRYSMPMFHYGMLTNPYAKEKFWKSEYPGKKQSDKVRWLDIIYRNYDVINEKVWVKKNYEMFGVMSPWFAESFKPREDGTLYRYNGQHPEFISSELLVEQDFRKKYNYMPNQWLKGE